MFHAISCPFQSLLLKHPQPPMTHDCFLGRWYCTHRYEWSHLTRSNSSKRPPPLSSEVIFQFKTWNERGKIGSILHSKRERFPPEFLVNAKRIAWKTSVKYLGWFPTEDCLVVNKFETPARYRMEYFQLRLFFRNSTYRLPATLEKTNRTNLNAHS